MSSSMRHSKAIKFRYIYFNSIATRLAAWFCFSSILLALVLSQLIGSTASDTLRNQISANLSDLAAQTADKLDQGFYERYREVQLLARRRVIGDPDASLAEKQAQLDDIQSSYQYYAWIGVTDLTGKILFSTKGILTGASARERPWFQNAMANTTNVGKLHEAKMLSKILPPLLSGEPLRFLDIAFPYQDGEGRTVGALGAHLSWEWARGVERSVITAAAREAHIEAMIVSDDGTVLLGPSNVQGSKLPAEWLATATDTGRKAFTLRWNGDRQYLVGAAKAVGHGAFPGFGWTVLVRQDADIAFAPVHNIQKWAIVAGVSIGLIFSLLGIVSARRISQPLIKLAADVDRYQKGKSSGIELPVKAPREIKTLARSFNSLLSNLSQNEEALKSLNADLETRVLERTEALAKSEARVSQILQNSHEAFIAIGRDNKVTDWNRQATQTFGWSAEDAIGKSLSELIIPEPMRTAHDAGFAKFLQSGTGPVVGNRIELASVHKDGRSIPIEISVAAVPDGDSFVANAFLRDITDRKAAETRIKASENRLLSITNNLPVLISYIDRNERFEFANATFKEWLDVEPANIVGKTMQQVLGDDLYQQRKPMVDMALSGKVSNSEMTSIGLGIERHLSVSYIPDTDDQGVTHGFYTLTSDVSVIRRAELKMATLARHDALTGLPNRYQLDEKLNDAVRRCKRSGTSMAVMFLDIDHFKSINDTLGHAAGDEVLKIFGERLQSAVRETDTVGRLAGDEFLILLENLHAVAEAETVAAKIMASVGIEISVAGRPLYIGTSIGIAFTDGGNLNPIELMAHADKALYRAKESGRGTFFCDALRGNEASVLLSQITKKGYSQS